MKTKPRAPDVAFERFMVDTLSQPILEDAFCFRNPVDALECALYLQADNPDGRITVETREDRSGDSFVVVSLYRMERVA